MSPGPARSYGPRTEPGDVTHARVAQSGDYTIDLPLYRREIGNGSITCRMLKRAGGPGRRIVQLVGEYYDAGVQVTHAVQCNDEPDELRQLERLEGIIRAAQRRPSA